MHVGERAADPAHDGLDPGRGEIVGRAGRRPGADGDGTAPVRAGRFAATSAAGLVLLVLAGIGAALLIGLLSRSLLARDDALARAVNGLVAPQPWLVGLLSAVTTLGDTITGVVVLGTLALALLARGRRRLAVFAAVAGLGALALVPAIKVLVDRLRPVVDAPVATAGGPSFPSGHTTTVTVWVGALLLVVLPAVPERRRRAVLGGGVAVVVLVGLTRLGLGVHYLSDVIGGWVLGTAWLAVCATAFRAWRGGRRTPLSEGLEPEAAAALEPVPEHDPPTDRRTVAARLLVVAVLLVGVLLALGQVVTRLLPATPLGSADLDAVETLAESRVPPLDALSVPAGEMGNTGVIVLLGLVSVVLAVAVLRRLRPAVLIATAVAGETIMFMLTATITGRPRPPVPHLDEQLPPTSSFPSGHTAAAVALYGGIALVVFGATRAWWRWLVLATAVAAVVLVAFARLYRGAHHPSDVLGSLVLALPWLYALHRLLPGDDPVAPRARGATTVP
jgi:undecaprenyl-diphosphatase